jgi:hypothetical protein
LLDVASRLGGFHGQVTSAAVLSAWLRVDAVSADSISRALWEEKSLVRTWLMRGTLHLLPARDLMLFKSALFGRRPSNENLAMRLAGVTAEEVGRLNEAILAALDGRLLTRQELAHELDDPRMLASWGQFLRPVTARGQVVFGPPRGQETTFVRVDEWLGELTMPDSDEATREVLRRYLHLNGPATMADFAWWTGGEPRWAGPIWAGLSDEMVEVTVDGRRSWMLAADLDTLDGLPEPPAIQLLGGFDPYVLSHQERSHIIDPGRKAQVSRAAGWISAVLLRQGRVAGTWSQRKVRGRMLIEVDLFAPLNRRERGLLEAGVADLEPFFGVPCDLIAE